MNQQYENVTESGIEPETSPLLEGRSTFGAISVRQPDSHILALSALVLHPTLRTADLKDEIKYHFYGINLISLEQIINHNFIKKELLVQIILQPLLSSVSSSNEIPNYVVNYVEDVF